MRFGAFLAAGFLAVVVLAVVVSPHASSHPDGLEKVAADEGFADAESVHRLDGLPTAGYEVRGVHDDGLSTALAGLLGAAVTSVLGGGLFLVLRRTSAPAGPDPTQR